MEKVVTIEDRNYEITLNYKDGYNEEEFISKMTEYFTDFDYIVGDWAYGKMRLKGFYDASNSKTTDINNFDKVDDYIQNNCAYGCRHFITKRLYNK